MLLVDEDSNDYVLLRQMLEEAQQDYKVTCVLTYTAALNALALSIYDVALVDWVIGGERGLDLLRDAHQKGGTIPSILLTSRACPRLLAEAGETIPAVVSKEEMNPVELEKQILRVIGRGPICADSDARSK